MKYDIKKATETGHQLYVYEESEKADEESQNFDDLWQSIYDVCKVASYGIIDTVEDDELAEALEWLKDTQELTKDDYQALSLVFD